jgi:hypothetical protein
MEDRDLWNAACTVCCTGRSSYKEYRAVMWADDHEEETGHKVTVEMEPAE